MTNYESTVYTVEDEKQETSAAFSTLPAEAVTDADAPAPSVMKLWHSTTLPDGQPINVSVLFTLDDVRSLQSFLNDQFGRGKERFAVNHPNEKQEARGGYQAAVHGFDAGTHVHEYEPLNPGQWVCKGYGSEVLDWSQKQEYDEAQLAKAYDRIGDPAQVASVVGVQFPEGFPERTDRQCPHISNGVQCAYAAHSNTPHSYETPGRPDWTAAQQSAALQVVNEPGDPAPVFPGPGDGQAMPSSDPGPGFSPEDTSNLIAEDVAKPTTTKKKVNRRKKEEIAYDTALETFRKNPNSQLEYTALTAAAEALRKRFPDATRLEAYDEHVRLQNIDVLLKPGHPDTAVVPPLQEAVASAPAPHFAPEPSAAQPTPFVPPIAGVPAPVMQMPVPEPQSAEEIQAAQAFPCQHQSSDGRQCTRPAGHELANPPKPHIYAADLQRLGEHPAAQAAQSAQPGFTVSPVAQGEGFTQATIPPFQIPSPIVTPGAVQNAMQQEKAQQTAGQQVLSFQIPPTPEVQGAELQPPAPAAPPWGGQG